MGTYALRLTRTVTTVECDWLSRDYYAGETVWVYRGFTYGCVSNGGLAVTEDRGGGMFFELPLSALMVGG